ncbi:DUF2752 domain-containing protein [Williamsia sp. CHRR-6]|uniref:DUF2752 domain-containing protein n=1 Tax=Williamsia sp. CHRR-6 TaxID=2835871 RepID=UPI001BDAD422|nr:DUF2752 domain-containing protein [Williamsia sp. CHRR-6]MBT0565600.1 DUF2752 domain-containing protein [Williamsia sp. CHRR-6]
MSASRVDVVRDNPSVSAAAAAGAAALVAAAVIPESLSSSGPIMCPVRLLTGLPCPGCGLTRSWIATAHGDLGAAFSYNAFGSLSMAFVAVLVMASGALLLARRDLAPVGRLVSNPLVYAVAAVWIGYGVVRAVAAATGSGLFPSVS